MWHNKFTNNTSTELSPLEKNYFGYFFFIFCVKIPMYLFIHGYLKHMLSTYRRQCFIAGILLKLGCYGFLRFYTVISIATEYFKLLFCGLLLLVSYSSLACYVKLILNVLLHIFYCTYEFSILGCFSGNILANKVHFY